MKLSSSCNFKEEIFTTENKLRDLFKNKKISEADFLRLRQEKVKPIFEKFHSWLLEKQQTAGILSSSKTAKANGLNPQDYLRCLFEKAPYAETQADWQKLLPWNIEITPFKMRGEWVE